MLGGTLAHPDFHVGTSPASEDAYNPKGYYESPQVNEVNEEIMASLTYEVPLLLRRRLKGIGPMLCGLLFPFVVQKGYRMFADTPSTRDIPSLSTEEQDLIRGLVRKKPFLFKDPRFCFTLSHWRSLVPDSKVVVIFRDPSKTAQSMIEFVLGRNPSERFAMTMRQALRLTRRMYERILTYYEKDVGASAAEQNWLFVHQNQVLNGSAFDRLEAFTERPANRAFPDPSLTRPTPQHGRLPGPVLSTYRRLCTLAGYEWSQTSDRMIL